MIIGIVKLFITVLLNKEKSNISQSISSNNILRVETIKVLSILVIERFLLFFFCELSRLSFF